MDGFRCSGRQLCRYTGDGSYHSDSQRVLRSTAGIYTLRNLVITLRSSRYTWLMNWFPIGAGDHLADSVTERALSYLSRTGGHTSKHC
jgi:hypothetical protein